MATTFVATKRREEALRIVLLNLSLCASLCLFAAIPCPAQDADFIRKLRERGELQQAVEQGKRRLAASGVEPREAAALVGQLSLIEVDRALAEPDSGGDHWRAAEAVIDDYLANQPERPEFVLLRLQRAINTAERGEVLKLLTAAGRQSDDNEAAGALRLAARRLEEVAAEIEKLRASGGESTFTAAEIASLANRTDLARCETLIELAGCYDPSSPDSDDALLRASEIAGRLSGLDLPAELLWRGRLMAARCERLLGRRQEARRRLLAWLAEGSPPEVLLGETAREVFATGDEDRRLKDWLATLSDAERATPEVQLVALEDAVDKWRQTPAGAKKSESLAALLARVAAFRETHGPRWSLRAEAVASACLATVKMGAPTETTSIKAIVASAEHLYRSGRLDQAVEAYDRAAALAYRGSARGRAFELALAAAAIEQSRGNWSEASNRFRRAALAGATHPQAPAAHRAAAICHAQAIRAASEASSEELSEDYQGLLNEHLRTWPTAETSQEARWWLIDLLAARRRWPELAKAARGVGESDPRYAEAVRRAGHAWRRVIESQRAAGDAAGARATMLRGVKHFQAIVLGDPSQWPAEWSDAQHEAALAAARLRLMDKADADAGDYAARMLRAATTGAPPPPDTWLDRAAPWLAVAHVRQGDLAAAKRVTDERPPRNQPAALPLIESLRDLMTTDQSRSQAAGELLLGLLANLPEEPSEAWRLPHQTAALEATGQADQALAAARRLAEQKPDNAAAQERLAGLLAGRPGEADQRAALAMWRSIEDRSRGGTDRWLRARLARIELMAKLGEAESARKLMKLTRVLRPNLGEWSKDYDALEQTLSEETSSEGVSN